MSPTPFLHPFARPARESYVKIVRGEGACVFDDQGKRYVDGMASLWYMNVGHGRAEIVEAVTRQMSALAAYHTYEPFTNEPAEELAARLAEIAPMERARVFLTCSGSEAVDAAIKLARATQIRARHPERVLIVKRQHAYHGVTYGAMSAQGLPLNQQGFGPLVPGFVEVPAHDLAAAERVFSDHAGEIAAVIAEPVQGAGGVFPPAPGYLEGLRRLCDEHGAYLVLDEVICGFGRLGSWFGAERFGVRPDLVTFAKGVTSGYLPVGGVLVSRAICDVLRATTSSCCGTATPTVVIPPRVRRRSRRWRSRVARACSSAHCTSGSGSKRGSAASCATGFSRKRAVTARSGPPACSRAAIRWPSATRC